MFRLDGSIAGRRRWLKTGPSTNFHRVIRKPMEGVMEVPGRTVSVRPRVCMVVGDVMDRPRTTLYVYYPI